ncbi:hypothetical protein U1Q18_044763 [Sarracenia purpurea var. burkii]
MGELLGDSNISDACFHFPVEETISGGVKQYQDMREIHAIRKILITRSKYFRGLFCGNSAKLQSQTVDGLCDCNCRKQVEQLPHQVICSKHNRQISVCSGRPKVIVLVQRKGRREHRSQAGDASLFGKGDSDLGECFFEDSDADYAEEEDVDMAAEESGGRQRASLVNGTRRGEALNQASLLQQFTINANPSEHGARSRNDADAVRYETDSSLLHCDGESTQIALPDQFDLGRENIKQQDLPPSKGFDQNLVTSNSNPAGGCRTRSRMVDESMPSPSATQASLRSSRCEGRVTVRVNISAKEAQPSTPMSEFGIDRQATARVHNKRMLAAHVAREKLISDVRHLRSGKMTPCSAKSMYKLADELSINELKERAKEHIKQSLTEQNIFWELSSGFTARYPEIMRIEMDFVLQHWEKVREMNTLKDAFMRTCARPGLANGE